MDSVLLSVRSQRTGDQPISYFMQQAVENPHIISLAAGLVDYHTLPATDVQAAIAEILAEPAAAEAALQYGTTEGYAPLRDKLLARTVKLDSMTADELSLSVDDVVVTTGSQQLLYLVGELLLDPGDLVITEAPSYFVYQGTLESMGVQIRSVPMDEDGMNTDALAELLEELEQTGEIERLRMIYINDYFQNPSGLTLSLPRRQHVMELVKRYSRRHRIFVLEDAAYRELRYSGPDLPSIKSFDHDNSHVILAMTFSKPLSPGLKTGYGVLPRDLTAPLLRLKGNHDFGSNNLTQHILDRLIGDGAYDRHVRQLCRVYREKRDVMLEALSEEFGGASDVTWTEPEGGLFVWATFPSETPTGPMSEFMHSSIEEGVLYVPGQFCYVNGDNGPVPTNEARLSFGVAQPAQVREGIQRLAAAFANSHQPAPVAI